MVVSRLAMIHQKISHVNIVDVVLLRVVLAVVLFKVFIATMKNAIGVLIGQNKQRIFCKFWVLIPS